MGAHNSEFSFPSLQGPGDDLGMGLTSSKLTRALLIQKVTLDGLKVTLRFQLIS